MDIEEALDAMADGPQVPPTAEVRSIITCMYPQEFGMSPRIMTATEVLNPLQTPGELLNEGLMALSEVVERLLAEACITPLPEGMEPADCSSVRASQFERTSPLRDEGEPNDCMGTDTDPGAMGTAESWFREFRSEG
jgi:hypothetical protein